MTSLIGLLVLLIIITIASAVSALILMLAGSIVGTSASYRDLFTVTIVSSLCNFIPVIGFFVSIIVFIYLLKRATGENFFPGILLMLIIYSIISFMLTVGIAA